MTESLLIIDDEETIRNTLADFFEKNYCVHLAAGGRQGITAFDQLRPAAVILDLNMPDLNGLEVLRQIKDLDPAVHVIMLTGHADIEHAVQAIKIGAEQFLTKPVSLGVLSAMIEKSLATDRLRQSHDYLKQKHTLDKSRLILSPQTLQALDLTAKNPDTTVLIIGPTGSGKGVLAELIHRESKRGSAAFIDISCAGLSEALLESELFGHERGAFTDAREMKRGLMEIAHGGTMFFDEIGEMPMSVQAKLLKAIESKSFRRVGGVKNLTVDVRVVAATNDDLLAKVHRSEFREDLYYRLNVIPIALAPLRERKDEIPELAALFVEECSHKINRRIRGLAPDALEVLLSHDWPGNVRELKNVIERAAMLCEVGRIGVSHLPQELSRQQPAGDTGTECWLITLAEAEKRQIEAVLCHTHQNRTAAARVLGIDVSTLARKIKRYQINAPPSR